MISRHPRAPDVHVTVVFGGIFDLTCYQSNGYPMSPPCHRDRRPAFLARNQGSNVPGDTKMSPECPQGDIDVNADSPSTIEATRRAGLNSECSRPANRRIEPCPIPQLRIPNLYLTTLRMSSISRSFSCEAMQLTAPRARRAGFCEPDSESATQSPALIKTPRTPPPPGRMGGCVGSRVDVGNREGRDGAKARRCNLIQTEDRIPQFRRWVKAAGPTHHAPSV